MAKNSLFTRAELLTGLFGTMQPRLYATAPNGAVLSSDVSQFVNEGGRVLILSNYRPSGLNSKDAKLNFTSQAISTGMVQMHNSIGDEAANRVTVMIQIYTVINGVQTLTINTELDMIEVDTVRKVIMFTDGTDVLL